MTRNCRDVLNHLRDLSENGTHDLIFSIGDNCVYTYDDNGKYYDYTAHASEFNAIVKELARTEHLVIDDNDSTFHLTYKGLHPYAMTWEELKSFLFQSLAVPIVISIITSVATFYITAALSR